MKFSTALKLSKNKIFLLQKLKNYVVFALQKQDLNHEKNLNQAQI